MPKVRLNNVTREAFSMMKKYHIPLKIMGCEAQSFDDVKCLFAIQYVNVLCGTLRILFNVNVETFQKKFLFQYNHTDLGSDSIFAWIDAERQEKDGKLFDKIVKQIMYQFIRKMLEKDKE